MICPDAFRRGVRAEQHVGRVSRHERGRAKGEHGHSDQREKRADEPSEQVAEHPGGSPLGSGKSGEAARHCSRSPPRRRPTHQASFAGPYSYSPVEPGLNPESLSEAPIRIGVWQIGTIGIWSSR